jgi:hypothetical protein
VTKSTVYRSMGCWRRNFQPARRRLRSARHSRASALVWLLRRCRAVCLNRSIPLTRQLRGSKLATSPRRGEVYHLTAWT